MELINLLPGYYDGNETMRMLQGLLSSETDKLETGLGSTISECFVQTASAFLTRYERMFALEVDVFKTDAFRRERIMAKISGAGTTTKEMIRDVSSRYSNGEVEVIEDNENSRFTIKFVGTVGIPGNMAGLKITIEEIKPAHLEVVYEYVYNVWEDLAGLTWERAATYTWEEARMVKMNE